MSGVPADFPPSLLRFGLAAPGPPAAGGAYIALFAMCASLGDRVCGPHQKVKLLIPGHIPGSFCEFRFCCLISLCHTKEAPAALTMGRTGCRRCDSHGATVSHIGQAVA